MATTNAKVLAGERDLECRDVPIPEEIGDHRALLEVEACGLCGTDLAQYRGEVDLKYPLIPGHEVIGRIKRIGTEACRRWGLEEGSRVAVGSPESCGNCEFCFDNKSNLCENRFPYGFSSLEDGVGLWGGYAGHMVLRPNTPVFELPEAVDKHVAAMFNPLANGIQWVRHGDIAVGDSVLVLGPGQRGLMSTIAAREEGAGEIIITGLETDDHKLKLAERFGATHAINVDEEDTVERVLDIMGRGVDCVIDTTPNTVRPIGDAINVVKPGGTIVLTGHKDGREVSIPVDEIVHREIQIQGAFIEQPWADRQAVRLIEDGAYPFEEMHTHTYALDDIETALETLGDGTSSIHVTVVPSF